MKRVLLLAALVSTLAACNNQPPDKTATVVVWLSDGTKDTLQLEYYEHLKVSTFDGGSKLQDKNGNTLALNVTRFSIIGGVQTKDKIVLSK